MNEVSHDNLLELPPLFYEAIKPYINLDFPNSELQVADTPEKLLAIWKSALAARRASPADQELIAEWAMSAAASSPLVNDNDRYEDIHQRFGALEVPTDDGNLSDWQELERLITLLSDETLS
jgi:hypothetical protein